MNRSEFKVSSKKIKSLNQLDIKSKRLKLQKFSAKEIAFNVRHETNSEIMRYIKDVKSAEETRAQTLKLTENYSGDEGDWLAISLSELATNEIIGLLFFCYESIENNTVEIGWRIDPHYQGLGYATEAAKRTLDFIKESLNAHKVVAYCVKENTASCNIMEKLGMSQEACFKQYSKLGGQWCDELVYGLILDE